GADRTGPAPPQRDDHRPLRQGRSRRVAGAGAALARRCRMSPLRDAVDQYLEIRRALGFKLQRPASLLPDFVRHLEAHHAGFITLRLALDWAQRPSDAHPAWWAERLSIVRGFARHLQAEDPRHQVPPVDLLPRRERRAVPVLFSAREIVALLRAARGLQRPPGAATYQTLFGLLGVTGI